MRAKRHILKEGNSLLVLDQRGNVPSRDGYGLFWEDTRHLSKYLLSPEGHWEIDSMASPGTHAVTYGLRQDGEAEGKQSIHMSRDIVLSPFMAERTHVENRTRERRILTVALSFDVDFQDIFEVRGFTLGWRRTPMVEAAESQALWTYAGRDGLLRWTRLRVSPLPKRLGKTKALWEITLRPEETAHLETRIEFGTGKPPRPSPIETIEHLQSGVEERQRVALQGWPVTVVHNQKLATWLGRSLHDAVSMLISVSNHVVPAAGLPWYATLFGRDSLIFGLQTVHLNPHLSKEILLALASFQGRNHNRFRSEQPGRIMHELRRGELAGSGQVPHTPYYGTVDATPLFLCLLSEVYNWTGDLGFCRDLLPSGLAAAGYIVDQLNMSPNGFLSYTGDEAPGLKHQGWKDSEEGVLHPDGSQPEPPIALCEVQGYAYWGLKGFSVILRALGEKDKAASLERFADDLRAEFSSHFWMPDREFYALGLDGDGRRIATLTSNPGHLLMSGILPKEKVAAVVQFLTSPDFFTGWGIRTMAASEALYDPLSYHNGSVWPHDTSLTAWGMVRSGHHAEAAAIFEGLLGAAQAFDFRLPELFGGFRSGREPRQVPLACDMQAWSAGTSLLMVRALLGLEANAKEATIRARPYLPAGVEGIALRSLRLGEGAVEIEARGEREESRARLLRADGIEAKLVS